MTLQTFDKILTDHGIVTKSRLLTDGRGISKTDDEKMTDDLVEIICERKDYMERWVRLRWYNEDLMIANKVGGACIIILCIVAIVGWLL